VATWRRLKGLADGSLAPLFNRAWRITKAPTPPAPGSIYVFLPNGTLLETSCVETYRIAAWTIDKNSPRELRVVEDRQPAFTAQIEELTGTTLRLQKRLKQSGDAGRYAERGGGRVCLSGHAEVSSRSASPAKSNAVRPMG
jgi:hypothetical protein